MTDTAERGLAERYGARRPGRRRLVVAAVTLLACVALGWLVWVMLFHGRPEVRSELVSFEVAGPHAATATVTVVRREADVAAACLLRAQAADHSIVGELNFTVGGSEPATATLTEEIRTEREATSVTLLGCNTGQQSKLR